MRLEDRTVLITGGTSGIGLELARQLAAKKNTVVVTGRNESALQAARAINSRLHAVQSDVTDTCAIARLVEEVSDRFPDLSVLVNNAGIMRERDLLRRNFTIDELTMEIDTNLEGPIRMTRAFLPLLLQQPEAAILNVTSGIAFLPMPPAPVYSAAKAGLHAWTIALRIQLAGSNVKVFELAPPLTRTPLGTGTFDADVIKGIPFMAADKVVSKAIAGMESDRFEIRPGMSGLMKMMGRLSPNWMIDASLRSTVQAMRKASASSS